MDYSHDGCESIPYMGVIVMRARRGLSTRYLGTRLATTLSPAVSSGTKRGKFMGAAESSDMFFND
jgi:hypothetical protein